MSSSEALNQRFVYVPKRALYVSLILHLAVPVLWLVNTGLEKLGIYLIPQRKRISLTEVYQNYIQVDVVGLPDELLSQKSDVDPTLPIVDKPAAAPQPKAKEQENEMSVEEKKTAEEKAASDKQEAEKKKAEAEKAKRKAEKEKALKEIQKEAEREAALKALQAKGEKKGRTKIAGNILSQGTSMSGMIGTAKERYTALVAAKVREHFNIFPWQKKKELMAVVYVEIYPNGRVKDKKLMKASRDPVFDAAVLQAIDESQPLPVPEDMALVEGGIHLEFRPEN